MKKTIVALALASVLSSMSIVYATTSASEAETPKNLTGNLTMTSNYMFRGVSLSNNLPALQGGLTYTFLKPGIYFNLWGSSLNTTDTIHNNDVATVEFDYIAGVKNNIGDNFSYDISIYRYNYPKAAGLNYNEAIGSFTYKIFTLTLGYSSNVFNSHGNGLYTEGAVTIPIPSKYFFHIENVSVAGALGNYSLPKRAGNTYNNYYVQINKAINNYTLSLQYANTNRKFSNDSLDGPHVVATVDVNF